MRKTTLMRGLAICLMSVSASLAWGQKQNVREDVYSNPLKAFGTDFPYPTQVPVLTPAPKGYKPFYISHYGRHGSRYFWSDDLYKNLDSVLTVARDKQVLSEEGQKFYDKFYSILPELQNGVGEMTPLGYEQHARIARTMYKNFPEVFKNGGRVYAVSSTSDRCIISMASFCQAIAGCNGGLDIYQRASRETLPAVVPTSEDNPYRKDYPIEKFPLAFQFPRGESSQVFIDKYFKDFESTGLDARRVQYLFYSLFTSLPNIGYEEIMGSPYSMDELFTQWEASNFGAYSHFWARRAIMVPTLEDILDKAEAVISGENRDVASLRFGHDSYLGPLTVLLGLDGSGVVPDSFDEVKKVYQNYRTGMAANIQLVFYRSSKPGKEILVKALLCGEEVTLPLPSDQYPYYRWSDFRDHYREICNRYNSIINN